MRAGLALGLFVAGGLACGVVDRVYGKRAGDVAMIVVGILVCVVALA